MIWNVLWRSACQAHRPSLASQMALDKNLEKPLASFEAQGHADGLNAELVSLNGSRSPLIPSAAVGARPLQTPQGKNH